MATFRKHPQNFEHFFVCLLWMKQQCIFLSDSPEQTDNLQVCVQPKWLFKVFSFCAATAQRGCPSNLTQSARQLMGNGLYSYTAWKKKKGSGSGAPSYLMLVCSSIREQNYSVSQFSYKRDDSNLSSLSLSLQLLQLQISAFSEKSTSRMILHLSYNLFLRH